MSIIVGKTHLRYNDVVTSQARLPFVRLTGRLMTDCPIASQDATDCPLAAASSLLL
ncbi:hypothetical protein ACVWWU_001243 [Pantoea sp. PA1]|uniref:hypothetical protein n=1 Tax=Pantoea TaxID=53335 RepID=UPI00061C9473|nr:MULTISPECIES: hypothetical protein [Pantoea]MCS4495575.1 hypothetical protein [Pantoea sp. B623]MDH0054634.1 hypothetical protein [Pantoea ananatis]MDI3364318.1 hypothetical protein [Pantoea sp. V108_6]NEK80798.1 hypothetical protein [Pantoea ananatis]UEG18610.1 hypothetical protein LLG94_04045 [Pantoea ananatis]